LYHKKSREHEGGKSMDKKIVMVRLIIQRKRKIKRKTRYAINHKVQSAW
jgi:hypothetical protein